MKLRLRLIPEKIKGRKIKRKNGRTKKLKENKKLIKVNILLQTSLTYFNF